jgi:hypothetical protein
LVPQKNKLGFGPTERGRNTSFVSQGQAGGTLLWRWTGKRISRPCVGDQSPKAGTRSGPVCESRTPRATPNSAFQAGGVPPSHSGLPCPVNPRLPTICCFAVK